MKMMMGCILVSLISLRIFLSVELNVVKEDALKRGKSGRLEWIRE